MYRGKRSAWLFNVIPMCIGFGILIGIITSCVLVMNSLNHIADQQTMYNFDQMRINQELVTLVEDVLRANRELVRKVDTIGMGNANSQTRTAGMMAFKKLL